MDKWKQNGAIVCFFLGLLLVTLYLNSYAFNLYPQEFSKQGLISLFEYYEKADQGAFFFYVLFERIKQMILFLVLCWILPRKLIKGFLLFLLGCIWAYMICVQSYIDGIKGVLTVFLILFPHGFVFGTGIIWIGTSIFRYKDNAIDNKTKQLVRISLVTIITLLVGCLLESYVNLSLLDKIF